MLNYRYTEMLQEKDLEAKRWLLDNAFLGGADVAERAIRPAAAAAAEWPLHKPLG
jgi:hypothetical protein